jgi:non-ribosomal peptide synthetase component F
MKDCIVQAASLGASLREAAKHWPAAPAFVDGSGSWSFSQMDESVDHVTCGLLALGLQRGDRIGVLGLNQIGWLRLFLAVARTRVLLAASGRLQGATPDRVPRPAAAHTDGQGAEGRVARHCGRLRLSPT